MTQYAVLLNATTDQVGATVNGLEYALTLHEDGHDVELYFDGEATRWPGELAANPDHPVKPAFEEAREQDLISGACGFCANAFGATDELADADIDLIGGIDDHGPDVASLVDEGYELLTI
jgi:hypothetical protein